MMVGLAGPAPAAPPLSAHRPCASRAAKTRSTGDFGTHADTRVALANKPGNQLVHFWRDRREWGINGGEPTPAGGGCPNRLLLRRLGHWGSFHAPMASNLPSEEGGPNLNSVRIN